MKTGKKEVLFFIGLIVLKVTFLKLPIIIFHLFILSLLTHL